MTPASHAVARFRFDPPDGDRIEFRPLDLDHDVDTLHDWFSQEHGRFWGLMGKTVDEVREIYRSTTSRSGTEVLVGVLESTQQPLFLLECYDPRVEEVGQHYTVQPGDRGFHIFVAPVDAVVPSLTYWIFQSVIHCMFADPAVRRIVAEPDALNSRVFARLRQAGFHLGETVQLRYKTAQMVYLSRDDFARHTVTPAAARDDYPGRARRVRFHVFAGRVRRKLASLARP